MSSEQEQIPVEETAGVPAPVDREAAIAALVEDADPEDEKGYADTRPPLTYCRLRQNDLRDGKTIVREAGKFLFGATNEPTEDDMDTLQGVIMASAEIFVRFENPDDKQPACGSSNRQRAEEWGYKDGKGNPMDCNLCKHRRHGINFDGNTVNNCKDNIQFFLFEIRRQELIVFQTGPSGYKPWGAFKKSMLQDYRRQLQRKLGQEAHIPDEFPWVRVVIEISADYTHDKGGYWFPEFTFLRPVKKEDLEDFRGLRRVMTAKIEETKKYGAAGAGMDGSDAMGDGTPYTGSKQQDDGAPPMGTPPPGRDVTKSGVPDDALPF